MNKTSLDGKNFISKSDFKIEFRGCLDELNAQIIFMQTIFEGGNDNFNFISDLEELRGVILKLQKCEVTREDFGELNLFGLSENEIHERSHNPEKYFKLGHVMPDISMKKFAAGLNLLRTKIRHAEIISCRAFENESDKNNKNNKNISHVLNRLSSAVYILIYKYLPDDFNKILKFGR